MPKKRSWTIEQLASAINDSYSYRSALIKLGLRPSGGNYDQLKKYIRELNLSITHFKGKAWNKGVRGYNKSSKSLEEILTRNSDYQSYKLKLRLIAAGYKSQLCEHCGWSEKTSAGYIPLELDHINGDKHDNRIENLRILCPNCHSLTPTYRG